MDNNLLILREVRYASSMRDNPAIEFSLRPTTKHVPKMSVALDKLVFRDSRQKFQSVNVL